MLVCFKEEKPQIATILENFKLSEELLNELMTEVDKDPNPEIGARRFYEKYKELLVN